MEAFLGILVLASPFIIYFVFKKIILKYFQKVYNQTGKNPINIFQQIAPTFLFLPIVLGMINMDYLSMPYIYIGIPLSIVGIVFISNLHWLRPLRILTMTLCHLIYGMMTVARILWWAIICLVSIVDAVMYGNGFTVEYNPFFILGVQDGMIKEFKKENYFFVPSPNPVPVLTDLHKYTVDTNRSRTLYQINQLEYELEQVIEGKRNAMIYGRDISGYETKEAEIKKELSLLRNSNY